MRTKRLAASLALCLFVSASALAQQTTGNVIGRILDDQGGAIPGASITAANPATGFTRDAVSDAEGVYRLNALPVGRYDLNIQLPGFTSIDQKGVIVNVGQTITLDFRLKVAALAETVTVTGESPLIQASASSVGGIVEIGRIESIPLNGRQFANLAATLPGVGLGYHSDPTKSTQYSPQINGGNGRNVNYQIDGGDNNDDTVGGLLQLFPLEAIQEFAFVTSRSKAENGRSNGGVMNIVTKSGTNSMRGSFFELFRDKSMNAKTTTEKTNNVDKQDYRRNQFGGSIGGPVVKDKLHYFFAAERTQQDTFQAVSPRACSPISMASTSTPYRENLYNLKVTANIDSANYLSVRYGRNQNSQPYGAAANRAPERVGKQHERVQLDQPELQPRDRREQAERVHLPVRGLREQHLGQQRRIPTRLFPNRSRSARARTRRRPRSRRSGSSATTSRGTSPARAASGHDMKVGVNFINEPRLYITFNSGKGVVQHTYLTDNPNGPISNVTLNDGDAAANIPLKQYAFYVQDDWARHRQADNQPRAALRPHRRLPVRPVEEPELRDHSERRPGRTAGRASRAWRTPVWTARTTPTTGSRASARPTTCAATAGT